MMKGTKLGDYMNLIFSFILTKNMIGESIICGRPFLY